MSEEPSHEVNNNSHETNYESKENVDPDEDDSWLRRNDVGPHVSICNSGTVILFCWVSSNFISCNKDITHVPSNEIRILIN